MKFDSEAYDKLFPREEAKTEIESAVSTFKPTEKVEAEVESEKEVDGDGHNDSSEPVCE